MLPEKIQQNLSLKHSKNGLVIDTITPLGKIQDFGRLPSLSQYIGNAIYNIDPQKAIAMQVGTLDNIEKSKVEFETLSDNIIKNLSKY
jgi:hypothetical protein